MGTLTECSLAEDQKFGPALGCNGFDFTLAFEQSMLAIGIYGLFLLSLPYHIKRLLNQEAKSLATGLFRFKIAIHKQRELVRIQH
jgi:hypothetical protein